MRATCAMLASRATKRAKGPRASLQRGTRARTAVTTREPRMDRERRLRARRARRSRHVPRPAISSCPAGVGRPSPWVHERRVLRISVFIVSHRGHAEGSLPRSAFGQGTSVRALHARPPILCRLRGAPTCAWKVNVATERSRAGLHLRRGLRRLVAAPRNPAPEPPRFRGRRAVSERLSGVAFIHSVLGTWNRLGPERSPAYGSDV